MTQSSAYLMAGQASELERLRLQSRVWEPAGRALLARISAPPTPRALDVGCGAMGWLRILSAWAGKDGTVVGTDIDERMLAAAGSFVDEEGLANTSVVRDDLFDSRMPPRSFDLVHARFQIAPLGRGKQQVGAYVAKLKPGGWIVLEDPDMSSWRVTPSGPAVERLIGLIREGFLQAGGDFDAGLQLPRLLRSFGLEPRIEAAIVALEPGNPYLRLPLQFARSLRPRLEKIVEPAQLDRLVAQAVAELDAPETWGTTFTLIQAYAQVPA